MSFLQNFCKHKWKSHNKIVDIHVEKLVNEETVDWEKPIIIDIEYTCVSEVLICDKCGKIEVINY
jgi:hypothetical protein